MEKALSMGAFTELDEREMMETEGGGALIVGIVLVVGCAIAICEIPAQAVDKGNRGVAQGNANRSGEPCTINQISIWNNIKSGSTYTAYPQK